MRILWDDLVGWGEFVAGNEKWLSFFFLQRCNKKESSSDTNDLSAWHDPKSYATVRRMMTLAAYMPQVKAKIEKKVNYTLGI